METDGGDRVDENWGHGALSTSVFAGNRYFGKF
jgi:hypothetical protein